PARGRPSGALDAPLRLDGPPDRLARGLRRTVILPRRGQEGRLERLVRQVTGRLVATIVRVILRHVSPSRNRPARCRALPLPGTAAPSRCPAAHQASWRSPRAYIPRRRASRTPCGTPPAVRRWPRSSG